MCVVLCRASLGASPFSSSHRRVALPLGLFLCPVSFYCGTSPKFAGLCTAPPGPRPAPHIAPRTGTPRRLAHLFQAWLSYSPNLIRRYVGKMCPSRVPVLHLTHTLLYSYLPLFLPLATVGEKRCSNLSKDPFCNQHMYILQAPALVDLSFVGSIRDCGEQACRPAPRAR